MERIFTQDVGKNFRRGDVRNYPKGLWTSIERSAGRPLETFTKPVEDAAREAVTGGATTAQRRR